MCLGSHQVAQRPVAVGLAAGLTQRGLGAGDTGAGLFHRQRVARPVEHEEEVAGFHRLVVVDLYRGDEAGDVRCDANDVGPDPAIAGPGTAFVVVPHPHAYGDGDQDNGDGGGAAAEIGQDVLHGAKPNWGARKATAPKTMT